VRLVLLELEHVIFDAPDARAEALAAACASLGLPPPDAGLRAGAHVATADELARAMATRHAPDDATLADLLLLATRREGAGRLLERARLRSGAAPFLWACASEGPLAAITRLPRSVASALLERAALTDALAVLRCADDPGPRPTSGAVIDPTVSDVIATWRARGVRRVTALVDRHDRLAAAARAGARTIAVPGLPPAAAAHVMPDPSDGGAVGVVQVTPDATWDTFQGRVPIDLDAPR
jgi:phosphoglycolate phosphatase-like HAD superfamily hydrolase